MRIIRKNLKVFMFLFAMLTFAMSYAQVKTITGKVTDASGESLPGAAIVVKGTTIGTITNYDGEFSFNVPNDAQTLVFSFVGMKIMEVEVENKTSFNISLEEDMVGIDEVVVIGYGSVKKSDATGAVTAIGTDDFNKGTITSVQDLLVGKGAGVIITSAGGAPGSGSTIRIRGGSSLNASNDPLIIIDGIPIDNNDV